MRGKASPLQYSLRTLLIVTTFLAVCLALVPWLTFACLSVAAVAGTTLAVVELAVYFHRAVGFVAAVTFFVIGCILFAIAAAVLFDQIPGYDRWAKLLAVVVFGGFALLAFVGARLAYRETGAAHSDPRSDSTLSVEPSIAGRKPQ